MGLILNNNQILGPYGGKTTKEQILATQSAYLEIYWPLDDASAPVQDESGNGRDGDERVGGAPAAYQVPGCGGTAGNAVRFEANDGLISTIWSFPATANHTLVLIFRPIISLSFDNIVGFNSGQSISECFWWWSASGDQSEPAFVYKYGAAAAVIADPITGASSGDVAVGDWGMYAFTRVGASSYYYRNGVQVASNLGSATSWSGASPRRFSVGNDSPGTGGGDMEIQHVAMWSTDLSESELDAILATTGI